jgi:hypothetical protein
MEMDVECDLSHGFAFCFLFMRGRFEVCIRCIRHAEQFDLRG